MLGNSSRNYSAPAEDVTDSDQGCQKIPATLPSLLPLQTLNFTLASSLTASTPTSWTRLWLALRVCFFTSSMFSQVLEVPGDDRAGEPLKEPWKHDANSLLFPPLGMLRSQVDLCPQGGSGSGEAWEMLGWMSWELLHADLVGLYKLLYTSSIRHTMGIFFPPPTFAVSQGSHLNSIVPLRP